MEGMGILNGWRGNLAGRQRRMAGCVGGGRIGRCRRRGAEGHAPTIALACGEWRAQRCARGGERGCDGEIVREAADPVDSFNVTGDGDDAAREGGGFGDGRCRDGGDLDGRSTCGAFTAGVPPPPFAAAAFHNPANLTHRVAGKLENLVPVPRNPRAAAAWGYGGRSVGYGESAMEKKGSVGWQS